MYNDFKICSDPITPANHGSGGGRETLIKPHPGHREHLSHDLRMCAHTHTEVLTYIGTHANISTYIQYIHRHTQI